jgi:RluA family pseudouridine synthase
LILSGSVYVNRHRNKIPATEIFGGAVVEVYYDENRLKVEESNTARIQAIIRKEQVLFEDEWIILMNKPAGIPTQPTIDPNRPNLFDLTRDWLAKREGKKEVYLGLHHRLDRDTSGVVLFTKKESANKGVADLFSEHRIQKTYQCLVWKGAETKKHLAGDVFEVRNFLGRISPKNEKAKYGSVSSNGDSAHTFFRVLEVFRQGYWLEASPRTGRTHQIRVHASELGLPILGDPIYFPQNTFSMILAPRLMLHAHRLEFNHPVTGSPLKIEAILPEDLWKVLGALKS